MTDTTHKFRPWRWANRVIGIVGLLFGCCVAAPQLLAFPYYADIGETRVYSETPLNLKSLRPVVARADARLATSPIFVKPVGTRIFLTNGGWRWRLLALTTGDAVGLTRPVSDLVSGAVILNRSDIRRDTVSGRYGTRSLSGVIAHERTHIMVRQHLGLVAGIRLPRWISEGYADHVAGESALSAEQVARIRADGSNHPALFYYEARQRVEAQLAVNGGDVETLLRGD
jgi:hypothetical protein